MSTASIILLSGETMKSAEKADKGEREFNWWESGHTCEIDDKIVKSRQVYEKMIQKDKEDIKVLRERERER